MKVSAILAAAAITTNLALPTSDVSRRNLLSRSSLYCREADDFQGCYQNYQSNLAGNLAVCTVSSKETCICGSTMDDGGECDVADTNNGQYRFGYCNEITVYVSSSGDEVHTCDKYQVLDQFPTRPSHEDETRYGGGWWGWAQCQIDWYYTWRDNACRHATRYIGETCWDGGECMNDGVDSYNGAHLSCVTQPSESQARCVPSATQIERNQCTCNTFDWNFFVACGSDDCNGHACVLNTGDGNKYCDYQTNNDW